ncbi:MAG: ABC transporter permease [Bacillota bacterium]
MKNRLRSCIRPACAVLLALGIIWVILILAQYDAALAFKALFEAGFKNIKAFGNVLNRACPLLFTGLAVAFALRGNMINIGAEGQFLAGTMAATWTGIAFFPLPGFILIPLMLLMGAFAGAAWGFFPAILKAKLGVSEVITTIMFNYVALHIIGALVRGPLQDITQAEPQSYPIAKQAFLPSIIPGTKMHFGFLLGIIFAVVLYILLFKTYFGYEVRAVGHSHTAAKALGISVNRTSIYAMLIAGGMAGIGGAIEIGYNHYLLESISPGYGFTAIAVAILASNNPIGVIFSSLLFGFLSAGSTAMQRAAGVSATFVEVFQGLIVIFIAIAAETNTVQRRRFKKINL